MKPFIKISEMFEVVLQTNGKILKGLKVLSPYQPYEAQV